MWLVKPKHLLSVPLQMFVDSAFKSKAVESNDSRMHAGKSVKGIGLVMYAPTVEVVRNWSALTFSKKLELWVFSPQM